MKPDHDDKLLEAMIRRAVGSETAQFDAERWTQRYRGELAWLASQKAPAATADSEQRQSWWSRIGRPVKVAASIALVAGIVIAGIMAVVGGGSTVAMAAVLERLQTRCYAFEMDVRFDGQAAATVTGMVLEPGRMRIEQRGDGPGPIVSILDHEAGQSLILFERFNAAYKLDDVDALDADMFGFLVRPGRSIDELWNLKAGEEEALGRQEVNGKAAEGFRVVREDEQSRQTIEVWADAETGEPLQVQIETTPRDGEQGEPAMELTLDDFRMIPQPDPALFRTEVPAGYTLAHTQTLKQLGEEPGAAPPAAESTAGSAEQVLSALAAWAEGNEQGAVEHLMAVDWEKEFQFSPEHHLFIMTERQYVSLVAVDQQTVMEEILQQVRHCRAMAREVASRGRQALASEDPDQAEQYFLAAERLGWLLHHDQERMLVVRLGGLAVQRLGLEALASLYDETGNAEKLREVRMRLEHLNESVEAVRGSTSHP